MVSSTILRVSASRPTIPMLSAIPLIVASSLFGVLTSLGDLDEVVAELGLHGTQHLAHLAAEYDLVEFGDHLPGRELAQRSALLAGRALRVLLRDGGEIRSTLDLFLEFLAIRLALDQDVPRARLGHVRSPCRNTKPTFR